MAERSVDGGRDRAVGALLGLASGDAVGTTLEFKPPGSFTPITDMDGGGPFRLNAGEWTDDTSMALCLAESIVDTGALDPADQLRRYLLWMSEGYLASNGKCFDIGITTSSALRRFQRTGETVDVLVDQEAAANGSLMRLAAVPIHWHADLAEAIEKSGESSLTTHSARRPVDACRVLGGVTAALISGQPAEQVLHADFWQFGPLDPQIEAIVRGSWATKEPPAIRGTGFCVDALEAALWAVGGADNFRDAILRAANLGDDADTTAAIAGQIAGARWGASGIPAEWRAKCVASERITSLAEILWADGGGDSDAEPAWSHDDFVHAWWVQPGALLAGEYPGDRSQSRAAEKVNLLIDAGIRSFVDLTTPEDHLTPYADLVVQAAKNRCLDVQHHSFGIPDMSVSADSFYDEILTHIASEQARGAVYVHCWGGVGRTGTVVGCMLADSGLSYDAVINRLAELRSGTNKAGRPCPEAKSQHEVIRRRAS